MKFAFWYKLIAAIVGAALGLQWVGFMLAPGDLPLAFLVGYSIPTLLGVFPAVALLGTAKLARMFGVICYGGLSLVYVLYTAFAATQKLEVVFGWVAFTLFGLMARHAYKVDA